MKKVLWFRRDLRVDDSMLLAQEGEVLPIFIFDKVILEQLKPDDRRVSYLYETVLALKEKLRHIGLDLAIFHDYPHQVFTFLRAQGYEDVYASIDYDAYAKERDGTLARIIRFHPLHDTYIFEPREILKKDSSPYLLFTPYFLTCKQFYTKFHALSYIKAPQILANYDYNAVPTLEKLGFKHTSIDYPSAQDCLDSLRDKLPYYAEQRDYLAVDATSHISLHLRFGTLSIRAVLRELIALKKEGIETEPFFRQLIFRDFYAYLLYHFPHLAHANYRYHTPHHANQTFLDAFKEAKTGVPLIDAAIRELVQTGRMHNRARMIVASFFTKHLALPWQLGEAFFAEHLLDYDAASNILSWQWCAGTGIDPQPYFRIFNPYMQAKKFDPDAEYIKRWLPELNAYPAKALHSEVFLCNATIQGYPKPIVLHVNAREAFIKTFKAYNKE